MHLNVVWLMMAMTATVAKPRTVNRKMLNEIGKYSYGDKISKSQEKGQCQVKIITEGNCMVDGQMIKPKIVLKQVRDKQLWPVDDADWQNDLRPRLNEPISRLATSVANRIIDRFLLTLKTEFGDKIDPLDIQNVGPFNFDNWGTAKLYSITINGLKNLNRNGTVMVRPTDDGRWTINSCLSVTQVSADFTIDARVLNRVFVKGWRLSAQMASCRLTVEVDYGPMDKSLAIRSLSVQEIGGFKLKTELLAWPFNELVDQILNHPADLFKKVIADNAEVYMKEALKKIDIKQIVERINI